MRPMHLLGDEPPVLHLGPAPGSTVMRDLSSGAGMPSMLLAVAIQFTWLASMAGNRGSRSLSLARSEVPAGVERRRQVVLTLLVRSCQTHPARSPVGQRLVGHSSNTTPGSSLTRTISPASGEGWTGCWPCRSHGRKAQPRSQPAGGLCLYTNPGRADQQDRRPCHAAVAHRIRGKWSLHCFSSAEVGEVAGSLRSALSSHPGQLTSLRRSCTSGPDAFGDAGPGLGLLVGFWPGGARQSCAVCGVHECDLGCCPGCRGAGLIQPAAVVSCRAARLPPRLRHRRWTDPGGCHAPTSRACGGRVAPLLPPVCDCA